MMKFNDFQKYDVTVHIPYDCYFELIYETKYLLEARLSSDRIFVAQKSFYGCNRRMAVVKATDWYNKNLKSILGNPSGTMFLDDPLDEVVYDDDFVCTDLRNKYLPNETIDRLLFEANGDLEREVISTTKGKQFCCVKRVRRRRRKEVILTDRLIQTSGGTIYYKMTDLSDGPIEKMKIRKVKLTSKSLEKAMKEVRRRGLDKFENFSVSVIGKSNISHSSAKAA